jgi:hypothetical protein
VKVIEYPFIKNPNLRPREIPISSCAPIEPAGVSAHTVADDLTPSDWHLEASDVFDDGEGPLGPQGAEFAPGGPSAIAGVVVVHSGVVTATPVGGASGDPVEISVGRWVLR